MDFRVYLIDTEAAYPNFLPDDFSTVRSVTIDLEPDDPLAAAQVEMNLALDQKIWAAHWYFVYPPDEGQRVHQADPPIAFVDSEGAILWSTWHYETVSVGDLQRASEYGFFEGDPSAVVLDPRPYGDGAPLEWADFINWLAALGTAASAYAGTKDIVRDVATAADSVRRIFRRHYRWLIRRGSRDPRTVLTTILGLDAWRTSTLASLLRLPEEDARVMLQALGYVRVTEDLHRRDPDTPLSPLAERIIAEQLAGDPLDYRWGYRRRR